MFYSPISNIVDYVEQKNKLKILCLMHDGYFERMLCATGHNFYGNLMTLRIPWDFNVVPKPDNFHVIDVDISDIPKNIIFNAVIANDINSQYEFALKYCLISSTPIILVQHEPINLTKKQIFEVKKRNAYITINASQPHTYYPYKQINYFVDTDKFVPLNNKKNGIAVGNFNSSDLQALARLKQQFDLTIFGPLSQISSPIVSEQQWSYVVKHAKYYININQQPIHMLQAMAAGCIVLSTPTHLIENGKTGFIFEDERQLLHYLQQMDNLQIDLNTCRQFVQDNYNKEKFLQNWEQVFNDLKKYRNFVPKIGDTS